MKNCKEFFEKTIAIIDNVAELERDNIYAAAKMMGDCMIDNGVVQLFGLNHGKEFAMELGYRAGGLMPFHRVDVNDLALRGVITESVLTSDEFKENTEMAHKLLDLYRIEKEDMFIVVSDNGCEPIVVEVAKLAKERGHKVIAVVSQNLVDVTEARHPSNEKLTDVADLVLNTHSNVKDAIIDIDETHKMNQVNSIVGNVIAQMLTAEIYRYLTEKELDCPVLLSVNVVGADVHNKNLSSKYEGRWNS